MSYVLLTLVLIGLFGVFHVRAVRLRAERTWDGDVLMMIDHGFND